MASHVAYNRVQMKASYLQCQDQERGFGRFPCD